MQESPNDICCTFDLENLGHLQGWWHVGISKWYVLHLWFGDSRASSRLVTCWNLQMTCAVPLIWRVYQGEGRKSLQIMRLRAEFCDFKNLGQRSHRIHRIIEANEPSNPPNHRSHMIFHLRRRLYIVVPAEIVYNIKSMDLRKNIRRVFFGKYIQNRHPGQDIHWS